MSEATILKAGERFGDPLTEARKHGEQARAHIAAAPEQFWREAIALEKRAREIADLSSSDYRGEREVAHGLANALRSFTDQAEAIRTKGG